MTRRDRYFAGGPGFLLLCLGSVFFGMQAIAQPSAAVYIQGRVVTDSMLPIAFARVVLKDSSGERTLSSSQTFSNGSFILKVPESTSGAGRIIVEHVEMQRYECLLSVSDMLGGKLPFYFQMHSYHKTLDEVVVKSATPAVVQKGDTIIYRAAAFLDAETRKVEDLLRRMPGFMVTPDGRIHYNGREVDRILIEGDDLTERNYRLLSKSLQAGMVDKVEVVQGYHPDRILGMLERSDRIGLNLRIDARLQNRLAIELGPGIAHSGRLRSDGQLSWISEPVKALSFLDINQTAGKPGIGLQSTMVGEAAEGMEVSLEREMPIQTGRIATPSMESAYVRDNRDASVIQVLSTRVGGHLRAKLTVASGSSRWQAVSREVNEFLTPDAGGWSLVEERASCLRLSEHSVRLVMAYDKGARHTGKWAIEASRGIGLKIFSDRAEGVFRDSLSERLKDLVTNLGVRISETLSLPGRKALSFQYLQGKASSSQAFDILTSRWAPAFGLSPKDLRFLQGLDGSMRSRDAGLTLHARGSRIDWRLSAAYASASQSYRERLAYVIGPSDSICVLREGPSQTSQQSGKLDYSFEMRVRKRWVMGGALMVGVGRLAHEGSRLRQDSASAIYRAMLTARYAANLRNRFLFSICATLEMPSLEDFLPERLDGEVTSRAPAMLISFGERRSLQCSYVHHDISKALSVVLSGGVGHDKGTYIPYVIREQSYAHITAIPSEGWRTARASLHIEAYLDALRSKSVSDLNWHGMDSDIWVNKVSGRSLQSQAGLGQKWVTALDGWFNLECGWRSDWMMNASWPISGLGMRQSVWQHQASVKVKGEWEDRLFVAALLGWRSFSPGSSIATLDAFASLRLGKVIRLTVNGHNLSGVGRLRMKAVSSLASSVIDYGLVGRYLVAGLSWSI